MGDLPPPPAHHQWHQLHSGCSCIKRHRVLGSLATPLGILLAVSLALLLLPPALQRSSWCEPPAAQLHLGGKERQPPQQQQRQQQQQPWRQQPYYLHVLDVPVDDPADARWQRKCCAPETSAISQYGTPVVLEQYVRSGPFYTDDPSRADIVVVPFYALFFGMYGYFDGSVELVSERFAAAALPKIAALPASAVLVFFSEHVDAWVLLERHLLRHMRQARPRNVVVLRHDAGDTWCQCFGRPFWGEGVENVIVPYAVTKPPEFVSLLARAAAPQAERGTLLFFSGGLQGDHARRGELIAGLQALNRSDVYMRTIATRTTAPSFHHPDYIAAMLRSKFCLVPQGDVSTSLRLYEAAAAECVPVIVADCMDVAFERLPAVGDYAAFSVWMPVRATPAAIVQRLDTLVATGGYDRLRARLLQVWPHFVMHNGSLPQPTAAELILEEVYAAADRMRAGLPLLSDAEAQGRKHSSLECVEHQARVVAAFAKFADPARNHEQQQQPQQQQQQPEQSQAGRRRRRRRS